ncbi:hypothetical protein PEC18_38085 [Paucibacter sp. O1-1]|nr:hypothetical protein [Paucibacter sp. O1-1]MDA3831436.1 hypothetical protein [Paucibacter sp. O1-1]
MLSENQAVQNALINATSQVEQQLVALADMQNQTDQQLKLNLQWLLYGMVGLLALFAISYFVLQQRSCGHAIKALKPRIFDVKRIEST